MKTELLVIEKFKLELVPFFTKGDRLDELLQAIKVEVMAHVPDVSTLKGRNAIKANITSGKNYRIHLEECGKKLSAEYKLMPKTIDQYRNKVNTFLFEVEAEARKELTAWEVIDKAEKKQIADTAAYLIKFDADLEEGHRDNELVDLKAAQAEADRKAEIKAAEEKATAKAEAAAAEKIAQAKQEQIEAEQREAKAKQDIIDAKAQAEKSERERLAAEEVRKEEIRIDYHKRMVQHIVDCGNGFIGGSPQSFGVLFYELENKIVIDESFEEFQREAELAKNESIQKLKDCQERIDNDRVAAEAKAKRNAEIAADNARQAQINKQQDEAAQAKADRQSREADTKHKGGINTKAMNDFIKCGLDADSARLAVKALAAGKIRSAGINY